MRRYETRPVTVERQVDVGAVCDGCGISEKQAWLIPVVIEVNAGEEGGRRDELDYCDPCLIERAPSLVAAGSKAPLVTGDDESGREVPDA